MKRYRFTMDTRPGDIIFTYNESGILCGLNINMDLTDVASKWFFRCAPMTFKRLEALPIKNKKITEITQ